MRLASIAGRRERGTFGSRALLSVGAVFYLLTMTMGALGQVPMAEVRGTFSGGNGSWDAESFGWFYYDLDEGVGGERLAAEAEERRIPEGHLYYSSRVWTEEFDYPGWGRYQAVAFLGKKYLAGYLKSNFTDAVSALEEGELREVLLDYEGIQTATSKAPLFLEGGYWIEVAGASSDGKMAYLILKKNGVEVDRAVVRVGDTYTYKVGDHRLPIIIASVSAAMQGTQMAIVDIDGLFQVRDVPTFKIEVGDQIGAMEVTALAEGRIELENARDIILRRGSTIPLAGGLMLRVRDTPELIYYPLGEITEYGLHKIRGPVYSESSQVPISTAVGDFVGYAAARWNDENFTGFYFDDDKKMGSESLIIHRTDERYIRTPAREGPRLVDGAEYICFVHEVEFEFDPWGSYQVVCFLGDVWFVGYGTTARLDVKPISMLAQEQIGRIIIDTDQRDTAVAGDLYYLGEGYTLSIRDVTKDEVKDDKIFIELRKNNQLVDTAVMRPNSTYIYKRDVGNVKDLPIIALHVENIFSDGEDQFAIIDGLFQVSDSQFLPIKAGDELGEMTVVLIGPDLGIYMVNMDYINLKRDSVVGILPGMNIAVADNDTLRYYIYKNEYVLPPPEVVEIYLPQEPVPSGGVANFSAFIRAGDIVSVTAETVDAGGRRVIQGDLTRSGVGARDQWLYSWQWNATVPALSDDGTLLPESDLQGGVLKLNDTAEPVPVSVNFDTSGRIGLIRDTAGEIYYISPAEYEKLGANSSYAEMASDEALRNRYVKIEAGASEIRFFQVVDGNAVLGNRSHKLWFSPQGIEPHLVRVGAPPGRYEVRLRVENAMNALQATGLYFEVARSELQSAAVGSATVRAGERFALPLEIPPSENGTMVALTYDPRRLTFEGIEDGADEGCGLFPDLSEEGKIGLEVPGGCSAFNLTFRAGMAEGESEVGIREMEGGEVRRVINGTVNVTAPAEPRGRIPAPGAAFALLAVGLAFCLALRRRR